MRTAIVSLILALSTVLAFSAEESGGGQPEAAQPAASTTQPDAATGVESHPAIAAKPAENTEETDPLKLAKPNALGEKILGGAPIDSSQYIIGAEDVLAVSVWHEPEMTRQVVVRPDGKITLPLINEVMAAGLTPAQVSGLIAKALLKYMNAPEVNVSIQQVNSKKYYIQGEVLKPGSYPLVVPTTIMEGLANAGGFRDFADTKKITILRGTERLRFNYKEIRNGKHLEQNVLLQPGDQIFVP